MVPAKDLPGGAWLVRVASEQLMDLCASANWGSSSPPKLGTAFTAEHKPQRTDHIDTAMARLLAAEKYN